MVAYIIPAGSDGTQISGYPTVTTALPTDLLIMQRTDPGGPIGSVSITFANFCASITSILVFPQFSTPPANPYVGQAYFDTSLNYPRVWGSDSQWHGIALT